MIIDQHLDQVGMFFYGSMTRFLREVQLNSCELMNGSRKLNKVKPCPEVYRAAL